MENMARGALTGIALGGFIAIMLEANRLALKTLWRFNRLVVETAWEMNQWFEVQQMEREHRLAAENES